MSHIEKVVVLVGDDTPNEPGYVRINKNLCLFPDSDPIFLWYKRGTGDAISGFFILVEGQERDVPRGYKKINVDLCGGHGKQAHFLCVRKGGNLPAVTGIDVVIEKNGDQVSPGYVALDTDLNGGCGISKLQLAYRQKTYTGPYIVDAVLLFSEKEMPPGYIKINQWFGDIGCMLAYARGHKNPITDITGFLQSTPPVEDVPKNYFRIETCIGTTKDERDLYIHYSKDPAVGNPLTKIDVVQLDPQENCPYGYQAVDADFNCDRGKRALLVYQRSSKPLELEADEKQSSAGTTEKGPSSPTPAQNTGSSAALRHAALDPDLPITDLFVTWDNDYAPSGFVRLRSNTSVCAKGPGSAFIWFKKDTQDKPITNLDIIYDDQGEPPAGYVMVKQGLTRGKGVREAYLCYQKGKGPGITGIETVETSAGMLPTNGFRLLDRNLNGGSGDTDLFLAYKVESEERFSARNQAMVEELDEDIQSESSMGLTDDLETGTEKRKLKKKKAKSKPASSGPAVELGAEDRNYDNLDEAIWDLECKMKELEISGSYEGAEILRDEIDRLKVEAKNMRRHLLRKQQTDDFLRLKEQEDQQKRAFKKAWKDRMKVHKQQSDALLRDMKVKQDMELKDLEEMLRQKFASKRPKHSKEYLDARKIQAHLGRQKRFAEAADMRKQADAIEQEEIREFQRLMAEDGQVYAQTLLERQAKERSALEKRIRYEFDLLMKTKDVEYERLCRRVNAAATDLRQLHAIQVRENEKPISFAAPAAEKSSASAAPQQRPGSAKRMARKGSKAGEKAAGRIPPEFPASREGRPNDGDENGGDTDNIKNEQVHLPLDKKSNRCDWCMEPDATKDFYVPRINSRGLGMFCTWECAKAWNQHKSPIQYRWSSDLLIDKVASKQVKPAPHFLRLKQFGGDLSLSEFRSGLSN